MTERRGFRQGWPWLALATAAALILLFRLNLSYDLGLFLPQHGSLEQDIVIGQMTAGPGSRLMLVGLSGAGREMLATASQELRALLQDTPEFTQVQNGESDGELVDIPETISSYRFLLSEPDWSTTGLADALTARMRDLMFAGGPELVDLIARDPYLAVVDTLERLAPARLDDEPWFTPAGEAVLLVETAAAASDITAQQRAIEALQNQLHILDTATPLTLEITGPGAFGVELQRTIRTEAQFRSLLALAGLLTVLFLAYRRFRLLYIAAIPLAFGFLCGLATTALLFDQVHGITLAFGFTLLGIVIDFPLHLFSHCRSSTPPSAMKRIWPTLRAGAASTLLAYLAMALAGSPGLIQLGTFTAAGLLGAVAITRFWLPDLLHSTPLQAPTGAGGVLKPRLAYLPALLLLAASLAGVYLVAGKALWLDAPESISPVPAKRLAADSRLRQALTSVDLRYQTAVTGDTPDAALLRTEQLVRELQALSADGLLEDWRAATQLLPSRTTLEARRARIPERAELAARLERASAATPFDAAAFAPFLDGAEASLSLRPLVPGDYHDGPLGAWIDSHLFEARGGWVSLVSLIGPDPERLPERLAVVMPDAHWIDLKVASTGLFTSFRNGVLRAIGIASLLIAGLLALQRLRAPRILWLVVTVGASLAATTLLVVAWHGQLTIIHLVALLLVFGLGLDYALFFSRTEDPADRRNTLHSVTACTASTTLAFGVLGASSIPFLHYVGTTTALGSLMSFVIAFLGSRRTDVAAVGTEAVG